MKKKMGNKIKKNIRERVVNNIFINDLKLKWGRSKDKEKTLYINNKDNYCIGVYIPNRKNSEGTDEKNWAVMGGNYCIKHFFKTMEEEKDFIKNEIKRIISL